jgi:tetratricopeptide (TPR) repeat protein
MAHNNLGLIYLKNKEWEKAETEFKTELEINPNYALAFFNSGLLYYQLGQKEKAEDFWKKTLEINANHPDAWRNLAIFYYEKKDFFQAAEYAKGAYSRGVRLPPELIKLLETPVTPSMLLRK